MVLKKKTDEEAKSVLNKLILRIPLPDTDLKPIINKYIMTSCAKLGTHEHKINSTNFIQQCLLTLHFLLNINESTKSYITDHAFV